PKAAPAVSSTQPRYPVSLRVALTSAEGALSGEVTDISAGGMFVRAERTLPVGALLSGALEIPDGERPVPVQAKVIHVAPSAGGAALQSIGPRLGVAGCAFGGFACHCALLTWNDREGRTRGEVVAKIDEAIQGALGRTATV